MDELIIPLPNGNTLHCGPGQHRMYGDYVRICDSDGEELIYWDQDEWKCDPELVMGAIFNCAVNGV